MLDTGKCYDQRKKNRLADSEFGKGSVHSGRLLRVCYAFSWGQREPENINFKYKALRL